MSECNVFAVVSCVVVSNLHSFVHTKEFLFRFINPLLLMLFVICYLLLLCFVATVIVRWRSKIEWNGSEQLL